MCRQLRPQSDDFGWLRKSPLLRSGLAAILITEPDRIQPVSIATIAAIVRATATDIVARIGCVGHAIGSEGHKHSGILASVT